MVTRNKLETVLGLRRGVTPNWLAKVTLLVSLFIAPAAIQKCNAQTNVLQGTVSVGSTGERLPGASLTLISSVPERTALSAVTNDQGEYKFRDLGAGSYTLQVGLKGFKQYTQSVTVAGVTSLNSIPLEVEEVTANVTVVTEGEGINTSEAAPAASFSHDKLQTVPLVNERFQDALPLVPGVVRGPDGLLNVKGARASQSGLTVNSSNVTDPVTGDYAINLPIEAIQSVEVLTNPYSPEYGEFTGAVTAIQTKSGSEKFLVNAQSIFPRFRRRGGSFVGIEAFTPRVTFSGPIRGDKLKFIQSFEYRFVRTPVENLPALQRDTDLESLDSLSQVDWDIDNRNHLTTTFSLFPQKLRYVGLNTFNPQPVTPNFKQRGFLVTVNEQYIRSAKSLLESSFSIKQFDADVFPSSGSAPMNLAPNVNSGNFFNHQSRSSKRYQASEIYSFSPPDFAGAHLMKLGGGFSYVTFNGSNTSNSVRILRADGTRSQQLDFEGAGQLSSNQMRFFGYLVDKWSIKRRLTLEYGVRYDRDNLAGENNFAPRIGFAFLPVLDGRTVVRGGVGVFYDDINLNVATFTQLQERVLTSFAADGVQITGTQRQRLTLTGIRLRTPRSVNWNVELDREWLRNLFVRVGYQQRQGRREFVLNPLGSQGQETILGLDNSGSSRYREFQVTTRYRFHERDELVASYVHSSAVGDLNDFNSYFGNFENPVIRPSERSLLPWDAPNRFLFWGEIHAKYGLTVAPVFDLRTGFPYSVIDEERNFVGARNRGGRYPTFASVDLQVLKSINLPERWKGYRAEVGVKFFNLTNHFNPRDFQNNLASDAFGGFSNGVGRKFGTKITLVKK
jgi:Carboxypeptidase regulatory-like domain/TonB-dependent Receptor Plug Domain